MSQPLETWMKRSAGAAAILSLAFAVGCQRRAMAQQRRPAPVVGVAEVVQKSVPVYGEWVGTLEGYVNAQIQPQVSGYLIRQDYSEGSFVRKDQVLFEIDPRPFQAVLDQARARLAGDRAQFGKVQLDVDRDIPEAKAQAIPQSQLQNDQQALLAARAAVEAGEAAVETAKLNLGYTKVRSLISGIAGIARVQVGNLVSPSAVLTAVSQVNPIKVYFPVSEQEYLELAGSRAGSGGIAAGFRRPIEMILSNGSTYAYRGRILFADRAVNPQTGTIRLVGAFSNPRGLLRPGQYARIRAVTKVLKNAFLVPQTAVTQLQGSYEVAIIEPNDRIQVRKVDVGPTEGTLWVVTKGLHAGERVVREGAQKVREGELVRPEAAAAPTGGR